MRIRQILTISTALFLVSLALSFFRRGEPVVKQMSITSGKAGLTIKGNVDLSGLEVKLFGYKKSVFSHTREIKAPIVQSALQEDVVRNKWFSETEKTTFNPDAAAVGYLVCLLLVTFVVHLYSWLTRRGKEDGIKAKLRKSNLLRNGGV